MNLKSIYHGIGINANMRGIRHPGIPVALKASESLKMNYS